MLRLLKVASKAAPIQWNVSCSLVKFNSEQTRRKKNTSHIAARKCRWSQSRREKPIIRETGDREYYMCVPSKIHMWKPQPPIFEDGAFKELKLNEVIRVGSWSDRISILIRRHTTERHSHGACAHVHTLCTKPRMHWGRATCGHSKKVAIYKPGRQPPSETHSSRTLILTF